MLMLAGMTRPRDRFFVEGQRAPGEIVELARDDARKVVQVLRKSTGDRIVVVDSAAQEFGATLLREGHVVRVSLEERLASRADASPLAITLAQAIPKGQKMDFVIEKSTELGIARLLPLQSSRSIGNATAHKLARWRKLAQTAAAQSGRTTIPTVGEPVEFAELCAQMRSFDAVLFAWELEDGTPLRDTLATIGPAQTILLVVGPEGGFTHDEVDAAAAAGAKIVSLGRRILRTETAAIVLLAALHYERGEI